MRCESWCQQIVSGGETRRIQQPGEQQSAIRISSQRNRIEYYCRCDTALLVDGNIWALKAGPHTTRSKPALCHFPHAIHHGIEYKVIARSAETKTAPERHFNMLLSNGEI